MRRATTLLILSATLSVGCGKAGSEAEARRKAASKFSNPILSCLLRTAPASSKLYAIRAKERHIGASSLEDVGIQWRDGERLIARVYSSATVAAKVPTEGAAQQRIGSLIADWARSPSPEHIAALARCTPSHQLLVIR
jgi:hypothetical protein